MGKDRAELQWSENGRSYKIVLRLEGDEWRVDDVHDSPAPPAEESEEAASPDKEAAKPE